jgi:hypothetical protein
VTVVPNSLRGLAALVLALLLGSTACGDAAADGGGTTMADSAGVTIATGPLEDRPLDWTLTELFRLGGADEGPGTFTAARAGSVATDGASRLYVLDRQAYRLEIFAADGSHLGFLGRQGGGPGELEFPISLFVDDAGTVHVMDIAKQSLIRWDRDGVLLPQQSVQGLSTSSLRSFGDTLVFATYERGDKESLARLRQVTGTDTTVIVTHTTAAAIPVQYACVGLQVPPVFSPNLQWTASGGVVAATGQTPYQIAMYRGGKLTRSVRRPVPPKPAALEDVARLYPEGMRINFGGGGGCTIPASEVMEKQGIAETVPLLLTLALDPAGRLWAERYTFDDEPARVDIFDAEGRYLGTLADKGPPLGFLGEQVVLFAEEHPDTGIQQVVAYQIRGDR